MRKIAWTDLDKRLGLFTKRNTSLVDLDNEKPVIHYSANTKINFVQKAIVDGELYFRTESARQKNLNWAVKASSFNLPDEEAPSVPSTVHTSQTLSKFKVNASPEHKIKNNAKTNEDMSHKDGGGSIKRFFKRLFKKGK